VEGSDLTDAGSIPLLGIERTVDLDPLATTECSSALAPSPAVSGVKGGKRRK
jgi:hypothetical protein